jgi:hypothetical protein
MKVEEVQKLLLAKGIRINVGACGCCDSPWIKIEVDGCVVFDEDGVSLDMIPRLANGHET